MIKQILKISKVSYKLFKIFSLSLIKDNLKKNANVQTKIYEAQPTSELSIGSLVTLTSQAKERYHINKYRGCCMQGEKECICEKMFSNPGLTGLITDLDSPVAYVLWSNNISTPILLDYIEEMENEDIC